MFDIVGTGSMSASLSDLARALDVSDVVIFHGWQSQPKMRNIILKSDVGVVPHRVTAHTSTTLPNKIYDYMALGRPVVVSDAPALQHLVVSANCGLVFRDQDPNSLLECLLKLRASELRRELGANGRLAVSESMNWSIDEAVILAAIHGLARRG
jgi:glycosyltransferase involved in cell wall biosynthesis